MTVKVLRLSHRARRDRRMTTHCALVARAFGAEEFVFSGDRDSSIILSVNDVVKRWGGPFEISYESSWRRWLSKQDAKIIHLTMYGEELDNIAPRLRKVKSDLVIIIGGEKVPREVYELADYNVSVSLQPHSEVASLALILDRLFKGKQLTKSFTKPQIKVIPQARGKKLEEVQ